MKKRIIILMVAILLFGSSFSISSKATAEDIPLTSTMQMYCWDVGSQYDISPTLLMSIVWQESGGRLDLPKNSKYRGVTQINPNYFKEFIEELDITDVNDPYQNIKLCGRQLNYWFEKYGDEDVYLIVDMWNKGEFGAKSNYNPDKPSYYAKTVVDREAEWSVLYDEAERRVRP